MFTVRKETEGDFPNRKYISFPLIMHRALKILHQLTIKTQYVSIKNAIEPYPTFNTEALKNPRSDRCEPHQFIKTNRIRSITLYNHIRFETILN